MPGMLYHVRVELRGDEGQFEYQFGFTESEFDHRILKRYRDGRAFLISGKIITSEDIVRIQIARSPVAVDQLRGRHKISYTC